MKFYRYGQDVPLQFTALDAENLHYLAAFDCGDENINGLIQQDALVKRTVGYLFLNVETDEVVAYCSLACTGIVEQITDFSSVFYPKTRSAIEIDYFAVAKRYQSLKMSEEPESETLSAMIFHYCIIHAKEIAQSTVGAEMIVLYSVPRACHFSNRRWHLMKTHFSMAALPCIFCSNPSTHASSPLTQTPRQRAVVIY